MEPLRGLIGNDRTTLRGVVIPLQSDRLSAGATDWIPLRGVVRAALQTGNIQSFRHRLARPIGAAPRGGARRTPTSPLQSSAPPSIVFELWMAGPSVVRCCRRSYPDLGTQDDGGRGAASRHRDHSHPVFKRRPPTRDWSSPRGPPHSVRAPDRGAAQSHVEGATTTSGQGCVRALRC